MIPDLDARLARNLDVVMAEISAPARSRFERVLLRLRVPEPTGRLLAATPAMRVAWFASVAIVMLFAASAGDTSWSDASRLAILLTLAPLVPVVGVALAYGPRADPAHEVAIAAPLSGLRLVLLRSLAVVGTAAVLTSVGVLLAPTAGWLRLAWLVPSLATTTCTLALSTRIGVRSAAAVVASAWLVVVVFVAQLADDAAAPFGPIGQVIAAIVTMLAAGALVAGRSRLERWDDR